MNRIILPFLVFCILILSACADAVHDPEAPNQKENGVIGSKLEELGNRYLQLNRFSGTIIVVEDGMLTFQQSFGLANYENQIPFSTQTAFKIGDISKLISSEILVHLVEENKLSRSTSLSQELEGLETSLTVADFLDGNFSLDYHLAGRLIEKLSGKDLHANLEEYSRSIGLENTYYQKEDPLLAVGYLYHNYRGEGLELEVSPTYNLEEAFCNTGFKASAQDVLKVLQSANRAISLDGYLESDGFSYSILHEPENQRSIVVLSNRRHPVSAEISRSITAVLDGKKHQLPLPREAYPLPKDSLKAFTGRYALNEQVHFEVLQSMDSLFVQLGPNTIYLIPQSANQFYMETMDASMRFLTDTNAQVNRVALLNGFIDSDEIAYRLE